MELGQNGVLEEAYKDLGALIAEIEHLSLRTRDYVVENFSRTRTEINTRAEALLKGSLLGYEDQNKVNVYQLSMINAIDRHEKQCLENLETHEPGNVVSKYLEAWDEIKNKYSVEETQMYDELIKSALEDCADLKEIIENEILEISYELFLKKRMVFIGSENGSSKLGFLLWIDEINMTNSEIEWLKQAYLQNRPRRQIRDIIEVS